MVVPGVKQQILSDLDRLTPEQQEYAAKLVHDLVPALPPGTRLADLAPLAGSLDDESAREMIAAIETGCERVDPDGW